MIIRSCTTSHIATLTGIVKRERKKKSEAGRKNVWCLNVGLAEVNFKHFSKASLF